ncbi:MAG TPA: ATPase domain-containing protein [Terriglobales bacterium]|nr:ATPase domain-containing protein [Terriglobales bacterium]HXU16177.1 ATPase domain-containing protein [Terriglobales bacterium]
MPDPDLVKTGIAGLDDILPNGIPRGNVILVEGAIGAGKTTIGVEFVYRGASQFDEPGIIVVFEVSPDKIMRDALGLGWDLRKLEELRKLKIVFTTREVLRQELQQADSVLLEEAAKIGARRIFIDGVGRLVGSNGGPESRSAFHVLTEGLQRENLTALLAVEASSLDGSAPASLPEESIADTVIRLRMEEAQRAVSRSIEIVKSRGQDFQMGRHSFRIIDGTGIQVYRRVQAPRRPSRDRAAAFDPNTRLPSGIPGLDEVINGGYFVGSTTVVAGISGVGKSVMGLQFIAEGARRDERSLMLSLDEQVEQIERNAASIGIDLPELVKSGLVRVEYEPPQEIEVDVHFHHIEELVKEFKSKRVLIDSLSTYGSALGTRGRIFRDFFHALVALMKEHQIVAVYNHENPEMLGMNSMMGDFAMSSLVDNIVLMNWIELGDSFRLGLTVGKMRANPVDRVTHECEILDRKGMHVLPRALPAPKLPFSTYGGLVSRAPERRSVRRPRQSQSKDAPSL